MKEEEEKKKKISYEDLENVNGGVNKKKRKRFED